MANLSFDDLLKCTWKTVDFTKWMRNASDGKFVELTFYCGRQDDYKDHLPLTTSQNVTSFYIRPGSLRQAAEYFRHLANDLEDIAIENELAEHDIAMEEHIEKEMLIA